MPITSFPPSIKSLTVGGLVFTEAEIARLYSGTTGIILVSQNATSGRGTSFRTTDGVDYQVPVGKTLRAVAVYCSGQGAAGLHSYGVSLGRSDAAVAYDTASPGTNPVYYGGASVTAFASSEKGVGVPINWTVAATKYPFMASAGGATSCLLYCFID